MMQNTHTGSYSNGVQTRNNLFFAKRIRENIFSELMGMGRVLNMSIQDEPLHTIYQAAALSLFEIEKLFSDGDIDPFIEVRTSYDDSLLPVVNKTIKIGVYPVAANPFHWGHLLIGLSAAAKLKLDKIIYIIAGKDARKPELAPVEIRHPMAQDVLNDFMPLFNYSSISRDTESDGETNLFHILKLNPKQKIDAYYIAGGDHYRRYYPGTSYPDTLQKLEDPVLYKHHGFNENMHTVSAAFIERDGQNAQSDTFLNVQMLNALPFKASSTMIREAFEANGNRRVLAILPYTAYVDIRAFNLYSHQRNKNDIITNKNRRGAAYVLEANPMNMIYA